MREQEVNLVANQDEQQKYKLKEETVEEKKEVV